jgi:4-hydroxyphenylacetate 3-monooxygenase
MRRGSEYIESLRDGRTVFLDGKRVVDVTAHPAFKNQIARVAQMYDLAGDRYDDIWLIPRSAADLERRYKAHRYWAECSYGLMGRTPDHLAAVLAGFAAGRDVFDRGGKRFGDNVVRFYEKMRREDRYVAYVIVPPQVDRSKSAAGQPEPFLYAGAAQERPDGIVVRGAQMIGTSAVMADWLFVSYIVPLQKGDEDYAISFAVPIATQGLRLHVRRPYATYANSVFDYPLSSRFDEVDALVVFDDVFVPWEQVFVYKDVGLTAAQFHETGSHLLANFQALVRFGVKLEFAAGLAIKLTELHNIAGLPPVQATLGGKIATICATFDSLVHSAIWQPSMRGDFARPNPTYVYTGMTLQRQLVIDLMRELRELAGGSFLCVPSSEDAFAAAETAADTRRYYQSFGTSAEDRVKFLKLMWDFIGTEFGGRQLQYEMFYSAAQHVADMRVFKSYDWNKGRDLVDECLSEYHRNSVSSQLTHA